VLGRSPIGASDNHIKEIVIINVRKIQGSDAGGHLAIQWLARPLDVVAQMATSEVAEMPLKCSVQLKRVYHCCTFQIMVRPLFRLIHPWPLRRGEHKTIKIIRLAFGHDD